MIEEIGTHPDEYPHTGVKVIAADLETIAQFPNGHYTEYSVANHTSKPIYVIGQNGRYLIEPECDAAQCNSVYIRYRINRAVQTRQQKTGLQPCPTAYNGRIVTIPGNKLNECAFYEKFTQLVIASKHLGVTLVHPLASCAYQDQLVDTLHGAYTGDEHTTLHFVANDSEFGTSGIYGCLNKVPIHIPCTNIDSDAHGILFVLAKSNESTTILARIDITKLLDPNGAGYMIYKEMSMPIALGLTPDLAELALKQLSKAEALEQNEKVNAQLQLLLKDEICRYERTISDLKAAMDDLKYQHQLELKNEKDKSTLSDMALKTKLRAAEEARDLAQALLNTRSSDIKYSSEIWVSVAKIAGVVIPGIVIPLLVEVIKSKAKKQ